MALCTKLQNQEKVRDASELELSVKVNLYRAIPGV